MAGDLQGKIGLSGKYIMLWLHTSRLQTQLQLQETNRQDVYNHQQAKTKSYHCHTHSSDSAAPPPQ
jgi:hypothetical protein